MWDLFTGLPPLMQDCASLLAPVSRFAGADDLRDPRFLARLRPALPRGALCARRPLPVGRARDPRAGCRCARLADVPLHAVGLRCQLSPRRNGHHQPAERSRQGDPRARDAQSTQGDRAVRRRGRLDPHHRARQWLRSRDARLPRRLGCERGGTRARRMGAQGGCGMPRGVGGRTRQACFEGQPAEHARRVPPALGGRTARRQGRPRAALACPGGGSRSRQSRHHPPHGGRGRRERASSSSARAATLIRASACARRWARSSPCRSSA